MLWCPRSSTLDLGQVKEKGVNKVSTGHPPRCPPPPSPLAEWGPGSVLFSAGKYFRQRAVHRGARPHERWAKERRYMRTAWILAILALGMLALRPVTHAQAPPPSPPPPATPTPMPTPLIQTPPAVTPPTATPSPTPAPTPTPSTSRVPVLERVLGHALSVEEAVSIALETQPQIQQRLADYPAAAFRVDEALSPLLPQVSSLVQASKAQNVSGRSKLTVNDVTTNSVTVRSLRTFGETSPLATVTLSQKIFDFGKTFATTEAARRLAEIAQEDVELQRQAVTFLV